MAGLGRYRLSAGTWRRGRLDLVASNPSTDPLRPSTKLLEL